ncbi:MAG TPA: DNA internalization-related competence protein ComEC/Rec2 [Candidatus Scatomorpha gallistercoris]|nr:DNA internalization-related competence protein ComEC/Rec2 [Candidatus Scatomorpha gallistercoris]
MITAAGFGFAAGTALSHYVLPASWLYIVSAAMLIPALFCAVFLRGFRRRDGVAAFLFLALGMSWYSMYSGKFIDAAAQYADKTCTVTVRVDEYPYRDGDYASLNVTLAERGEPSLGIAVSDYSGTLPELRPGDLAEMELELMDAGERYGEATDVYAARGVHLRAYYVALHGVERDGRSALYFPQELMNAVRGSIVRVFPEDVQDIMLALLIGDTHGVYEDVELDNALSVTGVAHVVSVSGMHLGFLYSALSALLGRRRAFFVGVPVLVLFTFMAGCSSAIVRACVMLVLSMLGTVLRRDYDPLAGLAMALLLLLAENPVSVASVSLQLSFASMLGLILITPRLNRWFNRRFRGAKGRVKGICRTAWSAFSASLGATVFTAPVVAVIFGYVSLLSPLANLLTLWAVSLAFTLGFAAAALGLIYAPLGIAFAWLAAWPARYFVWCISLLARIPYAAVYTADGGVVWWLLFTYAVFIAAIVMRRRRGLRLAVPALCSAAVLAAVLISSSLRTADERSVTVLDVGQGQSIALLSGESAVVVDCGGMGSWDDAGDVASEYLLGRGRYGIDALVLTHLHSDHADGAARLLTRVKVGTLYMPEGTDDSDGELAGILEAAARRGTEVVEISEDTAVSLPGLELSLTAPQDTGDENERGLVVRASIGEYDTVITGDVGAPTERLLAEEGKLPPSELLIAGHHGSRSSNSFELVSAVRPETVVVSVGYNSYGHPTDEALVRLAVTGADIYRTDVNGDVTVTIE